MYNKKELKAGPLTHKKSNPFGKDVDYIPFDGQSQYMYLTDEEIAAYKAGGYVVEEDGGEEPKNNRKFKRELMKEYPGMQDVYGRRGQKLRITEDPNFVPSQYGKFGNIEFIPPRKEPIIYTDDYSYSSPHPRKYNVVYNSAGANRGDIFLDMMHGMRDDENYMKLLENFSNIVKQDRGANMDKWWAVDEAGGYSDGREQWDKNYIDGVLRGQLSGLDPLAATSFGKEGYAKERELDTEAIRSAAEDIYTYLKTKHKDGGDIYFPPKSNPANDFAVTDPRSMAKGGDPVKPDPKTQFYTVQGSDGVYRKVNGNWEVDWNRSGKFQPLSKGDVAKRTAVLNSQAKPLYDSVYDNLYATQRQQFTPKPVNKPTPAKSTGKIESFDNSLYTADETSDGKPVNYVDKNDPSKLYVMWGDVVTQPGRPGGSLIKDKDEIANIKKNVRVATQFDLDRLPANQIYSSFDELEYIRRAASGEDPYAVRAEIKNKEVPNKNQILFDNNFELKDENPNKWDPLQKDLMQDASDKGQQFMKDWQNSPMYWEMLSNSLPGDQSKYMPYYASGRDNQLSILNPLYMNEAYTPDEWSKSTGLTAAAESVGAGTVYIYPKTYSDIPQFALPTHEYSHVADDNGRLIPQKDIDLMRSFLGDPMERKRQFFNYDYDTSNEGRQKIKAQYDYISNPTETRARLNELRFLGKESGIYDPFTQKVTPEIFKQLNNLESSPGYNQPLKDLRDVYTDEQILQMLNTISKNNESNQEFNFAQKGGELDMYPKGGGLGKGKKGKPKKVEPFVTSDPAEYAYRKAAYDDSLWLHENNLRTPELMKPNKQKYHANDSWFRKLAKWSVDENVIGRKNLTLSPEEFKKGLNTTWKSEGVGRLVSQITGDKSDGKTIKHQDLYTTNEADKHAREFSPVRKEYYDPKNNNGVRLARRLLPNNEPIKYVGNMLRAKNNTGEIGDVISNFETRYKKPVQPVIFQEPPKSKPGIKPKPLVKKEVVKEVEVKPNVIPQPIPTVVNLEPVIEKKPEPPGPPPPRPGTDVMPVYNTDELPMYATPDPDAEWVGNTERYVDWDGNKIPYRLPKFRKPGHSGDLIKPGKRRYIPIPSIETRYQAEIIPEEEFKNGGVLNIPWYKYAGDTYTHYNMGGNTDPGNNALELHMFYDKDVFIDGGKVYSIKGEKYYKGPDGNWYRGENMDPQQRIYDKGTLNYINTNAVSSAPTDKGPQGAPKPKVNQAVWENAAGTSQKNAIAREKQLQALKVSPVLADQEKADQIEQNQKFERGLYEMQQRQAYQHEQPLDMMNWLWGAAAVAPVVAPGLWAAAESAGTTVLPYIEGALNTSIPGMASVPGATVGNALGAMAAVDSGRHLLDVPSQVQKGEYADAAANILTGALDIGTAGMISPLYKGAKATTSELGKLLGTEEGLLSNAYKVNPFAVKENPEMFLYRARPVGQNLNMNMAAQIKAKQAAGEPLTWWEKNLLNPQTNPQMLAREKYYGQWFEKDPSRLDFYINPGTRNFADNDAIEILRTRLPKEKAAKLNVSQFDDAKILSASPETEFILPKDMISSAETFPESSWQQLIQEDKAFNKPHWLKGYKEVPKELPGSPNGTFAYRNVTSSRVRSTNTGLTNADVDTEVAKNIEWITSKEYARRRAANTGESLQEIQKSVDKIIKDADKAKFNLNANPKYMDLYDAEGMMSKKEWFRPAKVQVAADAKHPVQTLKHEIKHLYSPAIFDNRKVYKNYPAITAEDPYLRLGTEQQVRHLNAREQILAENNLPIDAQLSEEQVREFVDRWASKMNKMDKTKDFSSAEDFDDLWSEQAESIQKEMLKARYNTDDLNFIGTLPTSQKVRFMSEYRDRLTKSITDALNKSWATVPIAGAALLNNSNNQSKTATKNKQFKEGGFYYEDELTNDEIQALRAAGYQVDEL